jgi:hypothetical protein
MSRRIKTAALQGTGGAAVDTYFDRVIKYIPADIVSAWVAVIGIVKSASGIPTSTVLWICFLFGIAITFVWTPWQTGVSGAYPAWVQATVCTIAFVVWVFALGEPFTSLYWYNQLYGSLALIGFTLVAGRVVP